MQWIKKGHLFKPDGSLWWSKKYALYPSPNYIPEQNIIRVFYGTVDDNFYGRTAYIDVSADNPMQIVNDPKQFVIDLGIKGTFDDCGATPACAITVGGKEFLYYSGFCRSHQSPYHIFSGLAIKEGDIYKKHSRVPVLDRTDLEYFDRAGQSVIEDGGVFKSWYVSGVRWETLSSKLFNNKQMPVHIIRYATSTDGIHWNARETPSIDFENEEEFGFGRPWVWKDGNTYKMWYSIRKKNLPYSMGYAESADGISWTRKDKDVGIYVSESGWDSEMICYGAVLKVKDKTYMFYNGNNQGETGFGLAELKA
ncbi:MAG: hypothetical protein ACXVP0_12005 [Bacteroidia bacterium]